MALSKQDSKLVKDIARKYGKVIDLEKSPGVLIEILRNFGTVFEGGVEGAGGVGSGGTGTGGTGTGGVGGGVSTIAVGITPPTPSGAGDVVLADVLKAVLKLQRAFQTLSNKLSR